MTHGVSILSRSSELVVMRKLLQRARILLDEIALDCSLGDSYISNNLPELIQLLKDIEAWKKEGIPMGNDELYEKAVDAISKLFSDTSVSKEKTAQNLNELLDALGDT